MKTNQLPINDPVADWLKIDVEAGAFIFFAFAVVLMLLFVLLCFGALLDSQPFSEQITLLLFAGLVLLSPAALLWRAGVGRKNPMNNKIYAAYALHPEKIVWVYVNKVMRMAHARFDIVLNDDAGNSRTVTSLESNYELRLDAISKRCPAAIFGFQESWEKLYRNSPRDFSRKVKESLPVK